MKPSLDELNQLMDVVFIDVYQFIAYREHEHRTANVNVNVTEISDVNYKLIWKLAGYDGAPERASDKQTKKGEWHTYVDDELISAASEALQKAWKATQSKKNPTRLFRSNQELVNSHKLNDDDYPDKYLNVVEKLTLAGNKWRQAIRRKTRRKQDQPADSRGPQYMIWFSPYEPYKCRIALNNKNNERKSCEIPRGKQKIVPAFWKLVVEHFTSHPDDESTCEWTASDLKRALGRDPNDSKPIRTQVNRFNDFWRNETGDNAAALKGVGKGRYRWRVDVVAKDTE